MLFTLWNDITFFLDARIHPDRIKALPYLQPTNRIVPFILNTTSGKKAKNNNLSCGVTPLIEGDYPVEI